jgi:predicted murein hydrolase (TIGR00659 family)
MEATMPISSDKILLTLFWSATTILFYVAARTLYRRWPKAWLSPLLVTPALLIALALTLKTNYAQYIHATHWLVLMLGPATVAFAVPIYEQRHTIKRYWPVLTFGVVVGSATAMLTSWALASALDIGGVLRLSLLPRSMSTPFAMTASQDIGGIPDLTAIFVVITGVAGAAFGESLLNILPVRSTLARGALFGMGAHGAGVAKAHQMGAEEGSIAGLVMILVGLVNVLAAPLISVLMR